MCPAAQARSICGQLVRSVGAPGLRRTSDAAPRRTPAPGVACGMAAAIHGTEILPDRTVFHAWAPRVDALTVRVRGRDHAMRRDAGGAWSAEVSGVGHGDDYQ